MKKLIFCFDGTCNDPSDSRDFFSDTSISNILKLHALFGGTLNSKQSSNDNVSNQKSFYYSGVGTRGIWFRQKLNAMFAPSDGDITEILDDAKKDLLESYQDGDEIYIFGFSRGAAIARMFATKYISKGKVKFLGVFDTVAATKGSLDLDKSTYPASGVVFENGTLGEHIDKAVHLLSIDEKRIAFQPTLFNKDDRVMEIWFSGVHSDIGGGYWFDGLSDITLDFMCKKAKEEGLFLLDVKDIEYENLKESNCKDEDIISLDDIKILPLIWGKMHEQQRSIIASRMTLAPRMIRVSVDDKLSLTDMPIVHHTVHDRFMKVANYQPYALRDKKFKIMDSNDNINKKIYHGINDFRIT